MGQCLLNLLTLEPEKVATGFFFFFWLSLGRTAVRICETSLVVLWADDQESGEVRSQRMIGSSQLLPTEALMIGIQSLIFEPFPLSSEGP